ncbi:unnamed protein product [Urochloa humidicola]
MINRKEKVLHATQLQKRETPTYISSRRLNRNERAFGVLQELSISYNNGTMCGRQATEMTSLRWNLGKKFCTSKQFWEA